MITLRRKPFNDDLSLHETIAFDTKANMLEHCRLINLDIPKSWRKAEMADAMADFFKTAPLLTVNHLPEAERALLNELLKLSSDAYVTHPRNDAQYLLLQKLHLVITYITPTEWHLFMPDCVRTILQGIDLESQSNASQLEDDNKVNLVDILAQYPKLCQVAFFITLEMVNCNMGNKMPYEDFFPYIDDLQHMEDHMMGKCSKEVLERFADLLINDMRLLYDSIEKLAISTQGKMPTDFSDSMLESALHSGTMLAAMLGILKRFHDIPTSNLEKIVLSNKRKNGHLYFKELEKIASDVTNEVMLDMMMCAMGHKY